jgi:hypothetical protein
MILTSLASDDEHENLGDQARHARVPAVHQDWRTRGGVDRIRSHSAAAVYEAMFHNSALLFRSISIELAGLDDLAEGITSTRPGLSFHLADIENTLIQSWKCKMAQYLNQGRP